tara:strand:- start:1642 stop:2817 length:1176 start_codon:yes stop_codon:yes gene_type:complete
MKNDSKNLKTLFQLDHDITFLNHGSYGSCPIPVFENYQKWQVMIEQHPVKFMQDDVYQYLEESRRALGAYINCDKDDLIYVPNPTHAVANIINNVILDKGDEVLTTDLEYGSCDRMWFYEAQRQGFIYNRSKISLPIIDKESFCNNFWKNATEKTKYIFISQITSSTGMILPIPEIVLEAKSRGIKTIIDGAHVPAHIDLNIKDLDPDYYVGACHKWLCCPKGVSFLYVKKDQQKNIQPQIMSWGWGEEYDEFKGSTQLKSESRFVNIFQWQGTRDMSAFLTVPKAIEFQEEYDWESVRDRCKKMIVDARNQITKITNLPEICPDNWLGQMATILFPTDDVNQFKNTLYNEYQIEIPTMSHNGYSAFRISIQGYNSEDDIDYLIETLKKII